MIRGSSAQPASSDHIYTSVKSWSYAPATVSLTARPAYCVGTGPLKRLHLYDYWQTFTAVDPPRRLYGSRAPVGIGRGGIPLWKRQNDEK